VATDEAWIATNGGLSLFLGEPEAPAEE